MMLWALPLRAASLADTPPPGEHFPLAPEIHQDADTFTSGQPIVGTTYFYWYDVYSGAHIRDPDGTDAMTTHPPTDDMADLSYRSPAWHYRQLQDMTQAGLGFLMPVFWGVPGDYDGWSFAGLPPLVAAHDRMSSEAAKDASRPAPPKIGLFYDTSTLRWNRIGPNHQGIGVDLTTEDGRDWFYATIRDFFSLIPPAKWARVDGKPIVFLYGANFAEAVDDRLFDDTRRRFEADFGTDLFLVRHVDWPGQADAWYRWGGALGLTLGDQVAGLGPGYDHSAVPGREPLVMPRRIGAFYTEQWQQLLRMAPERRPSIVHVETWNEWHEGTDIARSLEYGDAYIKLTARFAEQFRDKVRLERTGPFVNARQVRWAGLRLDGLTLRPSSGDGCWERCLVDGQHAVVTVPAPQARAGRYLYFDLDDSYAFDEVARSAEVTVVFRDDAGCARFWIAYDNGDPSIGPVAGAFRPSRSVPVGDEGAWRTAQFQLPDVRFANRTHGADLRLAVLGGAQRLTVREVAVRMLPGRLVAQSGPASETE